MSASFILGTSEILNMEDTMKLAEANGGATLIPMMVDPDSTNELMFVNQDSMTTGYMVSVAGQGVGLAPHEFAPSAVERYVNRKFIPFRDNYPSSLDSVPFFGLWRSEGGFWYLDVSLCIRDKATAVHLARTTGELAIWDNAAGVALSMFEG